MKASGAGRAADQSRQSFLASMGQTFRRLLELHGLDAVGRTVADEVDDALDGPTGVDVGAAVVVAEAARLRAPVGQFDREPVEGHVRGYRSPTKLDYTGATSTKSRPEK